MTSPVDQQEVINFATDTVSGGGYVPEGFEGATASLSMLHRDGQFHETNTVVAQAGQATELWGQKWYPFNTTVGFDRGERCLTRPEGIGCYTILKATYSGVPISFPLAGGSNCVGGVTSFDEYVRQCSTQEAIVCEPDIDPYFVNMRACESAPTQSPCSYGPVPYANSSANLRRLGCPYGRKVDLWPNGAADPVRFGLRAKRTTTFVTTQIPELQDAQVDSLSWMGDKGSFVDLYDTDFVSTEYAPAYGAARGSAGGGFIRIATDSFAENMEAWDGRFRLLGAGDELVPGYNWDGIKTVKSYDRGFCSAILPWRTLLNDVRAAVDSGLIANSEGDVTVFSGSRAALTPVLSTAREDESQGVITFAQRIVAQGKKYGLTGQVTTFLRIVFDIQAVDNKLVGKLMKLDMADTDSNIWADLGSNPDAEVADARAKIQDSFSTEINDSLAKLGMVNVRRVNYRPEGLELVLAEDANDSQAPLAAAVGACNRGSMEGISTGMFGGIFDPPFDSDPPVHRDSKDTNQRLEVDPATLTVKGMIFD